MYKDKPQLLADRNINPKISDVYNIFKELFIELEKRVNIITRT